MKLIDLLCMAPAVFDKLGAACDRLNAFAHEVFHASPSIQEYLENMTGFSASPRTRTGNSRIRHETSRLPCSSRSAFGFR